MKLAKPEKSVKVVKPVEPMRWLHRLPHVSRVPLVGRIVLLGVVLLGFGIGLGWAVAVLSPGGFSLTQQQRAPGALVMISGRDDHGILQQSTVSLLRGPDDNTVVVNVADGSFARVVRQRGEWLQVELVNDPETGGWVNDYYLRGRMLRKDGIGQVDLVDARMLQGKVWVGVRPVDNPAAELVWLDASMLQEIGADDHR